MDTPANSREYVIEQLKMALSVATFHNLYGVARVIDMAIEELTKK